MKINLNNIKSLFFLSLVGSGWGKKEKSTSKSKTLTTAYPSAISFDSLPQIGTNASEEASSADPTLVLGGYPILMMDDLNRENIKNCTISFFTLYTNSSDDCEYGGGVPIGILTSSLCSPIACSEDGDIIRVLTRDKSSYLGNITDSSHLGDVTYCTTFGDYNTDYSLTSIFDIFTAQNKFLSYVSGLTNNDKTVSELYPVVGTSLPQLGIVCAYGSGSGYLCGNLVGSDLELTIPSPWTSGSNVTFQGLGKIDLGTNGFENAEDIGGPVYDVLNQQGKKTMAQALGYITWFDNSDPNHKLVYYTPLEKALSALFNNTQCSYSLLTSNDTSAKEFRAQVEVPTKK